MRRSVLAVAAVSLLAACATPTPTPSPAPTMVTARMFWAVDTGTAIRLVREDARIATSDTPGLSALRYLVGHHPVDPDYTNLWPENTVINGVTITGSGATVDIAAVHLNVGAEAEQIAIEQLLWTLFAAQPGLTSMRLTVDGASVESLAGHVDATQPFVRPPAYEVVALVWLLAPHEGAALHGGSVRLAGMACTFEANVVWTIRRGSTVVKSGSTTAAEACPRWSPWTVTVTGLAPGRYVADAADYSAKDGSLLVRDTKSFTIE